MMAEFLSCTSEDNSNKFMVAFQMTPPSRPAFPIDFCYLHSGEGGTLQILLFLSLSQLSSQHRHSSQIYKHTTHTQIQQFGISTFKTSEKHFIKRHYIPQQIFHHLLIHQSQEFAKHFSSYKILMLNFYSLYLCLPHCLSLSFLSHCLSVCLSVCLSLSLSLSYSLSLSLTLSLSRILLY